ncbi:MAG TPA: DUF2585 domain-containing protein [Vicinamibacterales bacterium]|nr:DUF2585 domain-containing protein [Vicinamibacterales bacterium]
MTREQTRVALVAAAIVISSAAILLAMGRVPYCKCGYVKLWHGVVMSSENSQHLTDWYTPSHVIHGIGFYALLWLVARRLPIGTRFLIALTLEASWEVIENTPMVINRYREATIALDYYGDSVINSVADIGAMVAGFWLASATPIVFSIGFVVTMEIFAAYMIRDNLTLNIIMLLYPLEAIKRWQGGG